jgi:hypothetical protein
MLDLELKYFTPAEANKTLPLVKKIVKDILDYSLELKTVTDALHGEVEDSNIVQNLVSDIKGFIRELEDIGCHYKHFNYSVGLVDFPAIINEREVFLCWKSDEDGITHYHGIEEGFRGRKEIPEIYLQSSNVFNSQNS